MKKGGRKRGREKGGDYGVADVYLFFRQRHLTGVAFRNLFTLGARYDVRKGKRR